MTNRLPRACFAARPTLKSILAELLPHMAPSSRLELFAREAGHRSDAAFEACQAPHLEGASLTQALAKKSASGDLLPLLVVAAGNEAEEPGHNRATARPQVPAAAQILRQAYAQLDADIFKSSLDDPLDAARRIDAQPARWLFAVATRDTRLPTPKSGDKFWTSKAQSAVVPILFLSPSIVPGVPIDPDLIRYLRDFTPQERDPWTLQSRDLIRYLANNPEQTMSSILSLVNEALGRRRSWWKEPETYDVGIGPGAV